MIEPALVIKAIDRQVKCLELHWGDGHVSLFHHIWLRDNRRCDDCGDRSGGIDISN